MSSKERLLALLALLLLIIGLKMGQQLYHWFADEDERVAIENLQDDLRATGVEVVRTSVAADSLKNAIDEVDQRLTVARGELERYEAEVARDDLTPSVELEYRQSLASYNARVDKRNDLLQQWQAMVGRNHHVVDSFNLVVDSIRALADRMGEPYYPIPSPAEIVNRLGYPIEGQDLLR